MNFYEKYLSVTKKNNSYVCVGLDSDLSKIPSLLKNEDNPILIFNKKIIDETYKHVASYKPNVAFYLAHGIKGIETLKQTIEYIPKEIPVIFDLKAGDIGNTMEQYAYSAFKYFNAEALTINILMGSDVIDACLSIEDSYCFVLTLTSNPSAIDYFKYENLYKEIAKKISNSSEKRLGAVVGATRIEDFSLLREVMLKHIFLIPGVGAQGGSIESVCKHAIYKPDDARILVNSSRGIIFADNSTNFAQTAGKETKKLQQTINKELEIWTK
ncbi:MAG: orotidine-5'-phosphate decarboxylase [Candidatus Cloacimonetes bacterium]|nr:orotidine-5'-phosphate decarboxylase [Candidatus Cloacimonadota bacterium]